MDREVEELWNLPPTLSPEPSLPAAPPFPSLNVRKRPFLPSRGSSKYDAQLADALNTSSDPALFSSDETPDAENYSNGIKRRKKKTYKGTWWDDELNRARMGGGKPDGSISSRKRRFRRNFDSGIFMADESSATDLSSDSLLEQALLNNHPPTNWKGSEPDVSQQEPGSAKKVKIHHSFTVATQTALDGLSTGRPINPKDHLIRKVVQTCLSTNNEMVDWTGMSLDYLTPAVTDLKSMIKRINSNSIDTNLAPFEAELKVFLGNNNFTQLPLPLLELTNIELLSMRQNSLVEISPGIRALKRLQTLNVSANNLQYLPYEVMELFRSGALTELHESPNSWIPLPKQNDRMVDAPPLAIINGGLMLFQRRAGLRRQIVGMPVEFLPNGSSRKQRDDASPASKQCHLSEMVLRALSKHNTSRADLSPLLSDDHPISARKLLDTLQLTQGSGGRLCTFCHRDIVLPRYQWYEWWHIVRNVEIDIDILRSMSRDLPRCEDDKPRFELFVKESDLERANHGLRMCEENELIPFQRMACGCVSVRDGLQAEIEQLKQHGMAIEFNDT